MTPPLKQIRALYDDEAITVYQAYSSAIAEPAVREQKLSASPEFKPTRMTWVKPSWCWMMYRCGYSYKDKNQERVLALRLKHDYFKKLLAGSGSGPDRVRIQWDPERDAKIERLSYRSIQIGIPPAFEWTKEIVSIEDATDKARSMKKALDDGIEPELSHERVYELPEELQKHLGML